MHTSSIITKLSEFVKAKKIPSSEDMKDWIDSNTDIPLLLRVLSEQIAVPPCFKQQIYTAVVSYTILTWDPSEQEFKSFCTSVPIDAPIALYQSEYLLGKNRKTILKNLIIEHIKDTMQGQDFYFLASPNVIFPEVIMKNTNHRIDLDNSKPPIFVFLDIDKYLSVEYLEFYKNNKIQYTMRIRSDGIIGAVLKQSSIDIEKIEDEIRKQFNFCIGRTFTELFEKLKNRNFTSPIEVFLLSDF